MGPRIDELKAAWTGVAARHAGHRLALPGDAGFICQPRSCEAHCCRAFHVAVNGAEAARLTEAGAGPASRFLESEDGEPLALPLARPYVLARRGGGCVFLDADLACERYAARPAACRLYPHQVIFVDGASGREARLTAEAEWRAIDDAIAGRAGLEAVPLLLRHGECPGFTGPPLSTEAWAALLRETQASLRPRPPSPPPAPRRA